MTAETLLGSTARVMAWAVPDGLATGISTSWLRPEVLVSKPVATWAPWLLISTESLGWWMSTNTPMFWGPFITDCGSGKLKVNCPAAGKVANWFARGVLGKPMPKPDRATWIWAFTAATVGDRLRTVTTVSGRRVQGMSLLVVMSGLSQLGIWPCWITSAWL